MSATKNRQLNNSNVVLVTAPENHTKIFPFFSFIAVIIVFLSGISSAVFLGDEVHHFRFAKHTFMLGHRAIFDLAYLSPQPPGFLYASDPAWPLGLSWLWKMAGHISFPIAQVYQTLFYALLLFSTFQIGELIYGKTQGWMPLLLMATTPMIISFSILFYVDVPATALALLSLLLLLKGRYGWGGVILGVALLTKRNISFFIPAFAFILVKNKRRNIQELIWHGFLYFGISCAAVMADIFWRRQFLYPAQKPWEKTIPYEHVTMNQDTPIHWWMKNLSFVNETIFPEFQRMTQERIAPFLSNIGNVFHRVEFTNSVAINPIDISKYFGIILVSCLLIYLLMAYKDRRDRIVWLCIGSFFCIFVSMFGLATDIRYLLPVTPFFALLAAKPLMQLKSFWLRRFVYGVLFLQLIGTAIYVCHQRAPSKALLEGFQYIKSNTPPGAVIIYPETNLTEYTERPMVWSVGAATSGIFWTNNDYEASSILKQYNIQYILIKKNRIYDDEISSLRHLGGFPKTFVKRLSSIPYLEGPVFQNSELSLWKIKHFLQPS